ncbi:MAG: 2OG-Fe(II) oxygenase [Ferruginibacter sp.]
MSSLKENILNCLKDLKGGGKFVSAHTTGFQFPGLEIRGIGEIAYPINQLQAKALIKVAQKAAFGKGSETILDKTVRSAWEIDASELIFNGPRWTDFLDKIIKKIKPDLGLEDYNISAHLYKMLIYEKGDFFLTHKDSEKEKGMFGTLVIGLPSNYAGGELVVRFGGVEEVIDFAEAAGDYKISYAAFYADCDHEIIPLTLGYRICLVYNLVQQKSPKKIQLISIETYVEQLAELFTKEQQRGNIKPHIVLLGHQYTPENFSMDGLKLNDRPKAEVLLRAAKKAGCYAKMCLVTSYIEGAPAESGGYGYDDDDPDEDAEIDEVYDESVYIEHWLENNLPRLSNVSFEENDLITSFALNDDEPIIKESTGYMGNYGPDVMHWYHYGAVMIWSREINAQLLIQQSTVSKLEWIGYFDKNPAHLGDSEIAAAELILSTGLTDTEKGENANFNVIADWIITRKDETFFLNLNQRLCQFYFIKIDVNYWLELANFFSVETFNKIFGRVTQDISLQVMQHLLAVIRAFLTTGKLDHIVIPQIHKLPHYFSTLPRSTGKKGSPATSAALDHLFCIEKKMPQDEVWVNQIAEILTGSQEQNYINHVLVPQLLAQTGRTQLTHKILVGCKQYLQERVNNKPQSPADWSRQMPATDNYKKQWEVLKLFLESPDQRVFDYRKNQFERDALESIIFNVVIDLKTETIKKGSPHTLRITKTQAAYQKEMKRWNEEFELLNKIIQKIEG